MASFKTVFPSWSAKAWFLYVFDILLIAFIATPLSIILWVSTWELVFNLVEVASHEEHVQTGFWIVLVIGTLMTTSFYFLQHLFKPCVSPDNTSPAFLAIFVRIQMYVEFLALMAVWVSLWNLIGNSTMNIALSLVFGFVGLILLRSVNSGVCMPMNLHLDTQQTPCNHKTRFMIDPLDNEGTWKQKLIYIGDVFVTGIVIEYLVIALWSGAFAMLNIYLLPEYPELSAWVSIIIGYNLFWIAVVLQFPAYQISKKLASKSKWMHILWEQLYWLYGFIMMVCLWRGIWNVITAYSGIKTVREPYNFVLSLVMHIVTVLLSMGLNVFNTSMIPSCRTPDGGVANGSSLLINSYLQVVSNMKAAYVSEEEDESTTLLNDKKSPEEKSEVKKMPDTEETKSTDTPGNDAGVPEKTEKDNQT